MTKSQENSTNLEVNLEVFREENKIRKIRNTIEFQEEGQKQVYIGEAYDLFIPLMIHLGHYDFLGNARLSQWGTILEESGRSLKQHWTIDTRRTTFFVYQGNLASQLDGRAIDKKDKCANMADQLGSLLGISEPCESVSYITALKDEAKRQGLVLTDEVMSAVFGPIGLEIMKEYTKARAFRFSIA